ncbi:MAG: tyrosine-protein phosphatase [Chloroflexi bacterium]|nr:tyrosine-protein phosphatase [Chloroflexota bacterium]
MTKRFIRSPLTASAVSGVLAYQALRGRKRRAFPAPESLVLQPSLREGRAVPMDRVPDFRDLGGYPIVNGRHVWRGLLYRSSALIELSEQSAAALRKLGIKLICDLRTDLEAREAPDMPPEGVTLRRLPIARRELVREKAPIFGAAN